MNTVPKPFASLSSGLLARKGQARPAMRRQSTLAEAGDALGWNDMGEPLPLPDPQPAPAVLTEREALTEAVEVFVPAAAGKTRKAFTLRLDADRHMRLRLAAATQRRSAQQIVTEALDAFLNVPRTETQARSPAQASSRSRN